MLVIKMMVDEYDDFGDKNNGDECDDFGYKDDGDVYDDVGDKDDRDAVKCRWGDYAVAPCIHMVSISEIGIRSKSSIENGVFKSKRWFNQGFGPEHPQGSISKPSIQSRKILKSSYGGLQIKELAPSITTRLHCSVWIFVVMILTMRT